VQRTAAGITPAAVSHLGKEMSGGYLVNLFVLKSWLEARLDVRSERGANLVEYVLLLAFIALVVIGIVKLLGDRVGQKYSDASSNLG